MIEMERSNTMATRWRRLWYRVTNAFCNLRWRWQRFRWGYAWPDAWEIDTWFVRTAKPLLQNLLDNHSSHPGDMTDEEWEDILWEMIRCLELMDYKTAEARLSRSETEDKPSYNAVVDCIMEHKHRFFELFDDYFFQLWD